MHGAKEGGRERESKRKRGEKRTRWRVRERDPHNLGMEESTDHPIEEGSYLFKWNICIFIILAFIS